MNKPSSGPSQLNLVNSSRLRSLRNKTTQAQNNTAIEKQSHASSEQTLKEDAETARLRRLIRQRLAEILAQLPTGKQHSLFKIRFGMTMDEFEQLTPRQAAAVLTIEK